jgi:Spy/CpxP family protein refolding chaperone
MHKKFFIVTAIVLAVAAGLSAAVTEAVTQGTGRHSRDGGKKLQRMTQELNLTIAQQAQIKTILQTEKTKIQPLRQQLRQNRLAQTSAVTGTFDETQVRAFAAKQAQIMTDLTVERERTKSQIYAVLTPDQRQKAQAMLQEHQQRRQQRMHKHSQPAASTTPG